MLWLGSPGSAAALSFDLSGGGDFGASHTRGASLSATRDGFTLSLDALSTIPDGDPSLAGGSAGLVFIEKRGAGVRHGSGAGSKAISGGGKHQDEALRLAFSIPVFTSSVVVSLTRFDPGKAPKPPKPSGKPGKDQGKKAKKNKDVAVLYLDALDEPTLSADEVRGRLVRAPGEKDTVVLDLSAVPGLPATVSAIHVRALRGHFLVTGIELVPIPEGSSLVLVSVGLLALAALRRRLSAAAAQSAARR